MTGGMVPGDRVTITFACGTETREHSFDIDDYGRRVTSGDLRAYLEERVYPLLTAGWPPGFWETGRTVQRGVAIMPAPAVTLRRS